VTNKEAKLLQDLANKEIFNKKTGKSVSFKTSDETESNLLSLNEFLATLNLNFTPSRTKKESSGETSREVQLNQTSNFLPSFGKHYY